MAATAAPASQRVLVDPVKLEDFMTEAYVGLGMPREDARIAAWGVVFADLRGHESHGVSNNVFGSYVPGCARGTSRRTPTSGSSTSDRSSRAGTATRAWASSSATA